MSVRGKRVMGDSSPTDAETLGELPGVMLQTMQNPSRGSVCRGVVRLMSLLLVTCPISAPTQRGVFHAGGNLCCDPDSW